MQLVNGHYCRNCADVELAKRGIDPAKPNQEYAGGEVYVPPPKDGTGAERGVNQPRPGERVGSRLNLTA